MYFFSDCLQCISYNLHKLQSIYTLGSRFEVAPFPPSALSPLTLSLPSAPSASSMARKRAVAKRLLQRTGATRPAAALAEAIWVAADAERAASIAARQEAECAASVASQQSADEEAAKHDAEFRRVAAENDARRAALAQSALVPLAPLDAAPKRRPPMPPPQQVEERLRRQALAQAAQEDLRRRRAAQRWQAAQPTGRAEVTPKSAPASAPPLPRQGDPDPVLDSFVAAMNRRFPAPVLPPPAPVPIPLAPAAAPRERRPIAAEASVTDMTPFFLTLKYARGRKAVNQSRQNTPGDQEMVDRGEAPAMA